MRGRHSACKDQGGNNSLIGTQQCLLKGGTLQAEGTGSAKTLWWYKLGMCVPQPGAEQRRSREAQRGCGEGIIASRIGV